MGTTGSKLEKALGPSFPENGRYFGFENFGNTCYCNSTLQALHFCLPFRKVLLEYAQSKNLEQCEENLLNCLADLFATINSQKKKTGYIAPKKLISRVRKENEIFRSLQHQDAHEFLNYVLNALVEIYQSELYEKSDKSKPKRDIKTPIHEIFEGTLTTETKCILCENITSRDESFLDLSIDISQNSSITHCLRNFSSIETMKGNNKFYCEKCCSLQEAQKSMKIKKLPNVLILHLKRFKYFEQLNSHKKLAYRVAFPFELKLCNMSKDAELQDLDKLYHLFAVVIHVGSGPNHGHYKCLVKSEDHWLLFDDDVVELVDERRVQSVFGFPNEFNGISETGYILFYHTDNPSNSLSVFEKLISSEMQSSGSENLYKNGEKKNEEMEE